MVELSFVMPMYNEEDIVESVVTKMQKAFDKEGLDYELVIVNNGSKDKTGEILDKLKSKKVKVVTLRVNQGYGWGIINGLKACKGDILGYADGDGQVSPEDMLRVYRKMKESGNDFAKAIRYARGDGLKRVFASFFYNGLFHLFFLTKYRDINAKPKFFSRDFYDSLHLRSRDWFVDAEIMLGLVHKPFKVDEVLVKFDERKGGKSNVRLNTVKEFLTNMIQWRITKWKDLRL
tara:strand:+ start:3112 stop:3810 length:699 start_codon:yes stop_codon:yes gene_type:complete